MAGVPGQTEDTLDTAVDDVFAGTMGDTQDANTETTTDADAAAATPDAAEDDGSGLAPALDGKPERDAEGRILGKDGRVLAEGREERRNLYNYNRLAKVTDTLRASNQRMETELAGLRHIAEMPGKLGLRLGDVEEAIQFRAQIDRDPVTAVREIVARVLNNGYSMEQLFGGDAPGYINGQMVKSQIDQHLAPLNKRFAETEREERITTQARTEMDNFVQNHEYADTHGQQIAFLVQERGLDPVKAYYELRSWAQTNGLDFSQPLAPQVAARSQPAANGNGNGRQAPGRQPPSTPGNRRAAVPANAPNAPVSQYANPDADYRSIVANAFREYATQ